MRSIPLDDPLGSFKSKALGSVIADANRDVAMEWAGGSRSGGLQRIANDPTDILELRADGHRTKSFSQRASALVDPHTPICGKRSRGRMPR